MIRFWLTLPRVGGYILIVLIAGQKEAVASLLLYVVCCFMLNYVAFGLEVTTHNSTKVHNNWHYDKDYFCCTLRIIRMESREMIVRWVPPQVDPTQINLK